MFGLCWLLIENIFRLKTFCCLTQKGALSGREFRSRQLMFRANSDLIGTIPAAVAITPHQIHLSARSNGKLNQKIHPLRC
jgi:hypothetical protein